jgi:hypothetical protein
MKLIEPPPASATLPPSLDRCKANHNLSADSDETSTVRSRREAQRTKHSTCNFAAASNGVVAFLPMLIPHGPLNLRADCTTCRMELRRGWHPDFDAHRTEPLQNRMLVGKRAPRFSPKASQLWTASFSTSSLRVRVRQSRKSLRSAPA